MSRLRECEGYGAVEGEDAYSLSPCMISGMLSSGQMSIDLPGYNSRMNK